MNDKVETLEAKLAAIDQATLIPLVRSVLNRETIDVVDWEFEQLHGGVAAGTAGDLVIIIER